MVFKQMGLSKLIWCLGFSLVDTVGSNMVVVMREERGEPCHSLERVLRVQMIALGMLDHHARRSNMVYQDLVPLRLGSSAMDYNFCMGPFSGSRELDISHRSLDVGS